MLCVQKTTYSPTLSVVHVLFTHNALQAIIKIDKTSQLNVESRQPLRNVKMLTSPYIFIVKVQVMTGLKMELHHHLATEMTRFKQLAASH